MATQRVAPDSILSLTNLSGSVSAVQDDPDSPDGAWLTAPDNTASTEAYVSFPTPTGNPDATASAQNIRALVRRVGGTTAPVARIEVWENGVQRFIGSDSLVSTTVGFVLALPWTYGGVFVNADGSGVEVKVIATASGGKPAARGTVEVGAIEWNATLAAQTTTTPVTLSVTSGFSPSFSRHGSFSRSLSVAAAYAPTISRVGSYHRTLIVVPSLSPSLRRSISKTLAVASSFSPSAVAQKVLLMTFTASSALVAALNEKLVTGRTLAASSPMGVSVVKLVRKTFAVSLPAPVSLVRQVRMGLRVTTSLAPSLGRKFSRLFSVAAPFAPALNEGYQRFQTFVAATTLAPSLVTRFIAATGNNVKRVFLALMGVD